MFKNWHVMRDIKGNYKYFHGDLSDYEPWEIGDYIEVLESEYTAEDILYLTDLIASDNGLSNASFIFTNILNILRKIYISDSEKEKKFALELKDIVLRNI